MATFPCHGCGYDLTGLDESGDCPECGLAIARSRSGTSLEGLDPAFVRRMRLSVGFMAIAAVFIAPGRVDVLMSGKGPAHLVVSGIAWLVLAWFTTARHPALTEDPIEGWRRVARSTCWVPLASTLARIALAQATLPAPWPTIIGYALALVVAASVFLVAEYPVRLLVHSGCRAPRRWQPAFWLALTFLLVEMGGYALFFALYPGIITAIGLHRTFTELQLREIASTRRVRRAGAS